MEQLFAADAQKLAEIRRFVREQAARSSLPPSATDDLVLAVSEACANAVRHTESRELVVEFRRTREGAEVNILDEGIFRFTSARGGLGLPLMLASVDEVTIQQGTTEHPGTMVRLVKRKRSKLPASSHPGKSWTRKSA